MQYDFDSQDIPAQIIGINESGYEEGNESVVEGRTLPWLQDTEEINAWELWEVGYRDVFIVDESGTLRYRFNLSSQDLRNPAHFQTLTQIIVGLTED
jgi:hypothetical protein